MKNSTFLRVSILTFIFLQQILATAQPVSNCDTIYLKSGEHLPATVYKYQKDSVFYFTCDTGPIVQKRVALKETSKVKQKNGKFISTSVSPADSTYTSRIVLFDKTNYKGIITESTNEDITFVNLDREIIQIKRSRIVSIVKEKKGESPGRMKERDALTTHYLLGSNNFNLPQGEHYYQNGLIVYNFVRLGITDHINAGAGVIPLHVFGDQAFVLWGSPKFQFPVKNTGLKLGGGGMFVTIRDEGDNENFGFVYGSGTLGSKYTNFTFGLGTGYTDGEFGKKPLFSLATHLYVNSKVSLVIEGYNTSLFGDQTTVLMGGLRLHIKRVTTDVALIALTDDDGLFFALPWLSCTFPFGRK